MSQEISTIDYDWIAEIAEANGIAFDRLCKMAETKGARTEAELLGTTLRPATKDWLTTPQAAEALHTTYSSLVSALMDGRLPYYGIDYRSRSRVKPNGKRGCGVLFARTDVEEVKRLRGVLGTTLKGALRVFQAKRENLI